MKLTATQVDILKHRLAVPDCIVDGCLEEDDQTEKNINGLMTAISQIETSLDSEQSIPDKPDHFQSLVLWDCIDGCTYLACAYNAFDDLEISSQRYHGLVRSGEQLAAKISKLIGRDVFISPT